MAPTKHLDQQQTTLQLTEANLQQQQDGLEATSIDNGFVENQIRDEQAQEFNRCLHECIGSGHIEEQCPHDLLSTITLRYRSRASSTATPMYKFSVVSTADDPMPLLARQALHSAGVSLGVIESIDLRTDAAQVMEVDSASDQGDAMGVPFRTERQVPQGNLPRVKTRLRFRKSSKEVDVRMGK